MRFSFIPTEKAFFPETRRTLLRRTRSLATSPSSSTSSRARCWDNAVAESFFATLKKELISRKRWRTRAELRDVVFEYIEVFYNRKRLHSALNYRTPAEVEENHRTAA